MKDKLIVGLLWFFGIVFLLRGLTLLGTSFLGGLFMALSGVVLLPIVQHRIRTLLNKGIAIKWFVCVWFALTAISGFALMASEKNALANGTATTEQVKQNAEYEASREEARIKREQEEAKKLADKQEREQLASNKTSSSSNNSSQPMNFDECKRIATSTRDELAGTQYKTTVHMDNSSSYEIEICTNDGSVDILCDGKKQEMTIFKMQKCYA